MASLSLPQGAGAHGLVLSPVLFSVSMDVAVAGNSLSGQILILTEAGMFRGLAAGIPGQGPALVFNGEHEAGISSIGIWNGQLAVAILVLQEPDGSPGSVPAVSVLVYTFSRRTVVLDSQGVQPLAQGAVIVNP